jgi:hypothetical protein
VESRQGRPFFPTHSPTTYQVVNSSRGCLARRLARRSALRCELERAYIICAMDELVNIAVDEVALEGPAGAYARWTRDELSTRRGMQLELTGSAVQAAAWSSCGRSCRSACQWLA